MAARHAKPWRLVDGVREKRRTAPGYAERIVAEVARAVAGGPQALAAAERRVAGYIEMAAGFGPRGDEPDPSSAAGALAFGGSVEPERVACLFGVLIGHDLGAHTVCPACDAARSADWAVVLRLCGVSQRLVLDLAAACRACGLLSAEDLRGQKIRAEADAQERLRQERREAIEDGLF